MACKLKSWKCFMKTLPEVATVAGIFRTNDCFKDLPDTKLDGFPCPAAVAVLPHPPCHQLHAAQRNIRPSVTHRSEETFEVETLHNNSSNRQALCKVENIFFSSSFPPLFCIFSNSGFRLMRKNCTDWTCTWGRHMKSPMFKEIKESQKINHFPGLLSHFTSK